ncbi:hypothetical protein L1887_02373 [Cichorium endivia]|nr:hypothetical protein L1887_02373 [Cichorium endivia]
MDKKLGGLGVGALADLNKALLAKWAWMYKVEETALWRKIIDSIHGQNWYNEGATIKIGHTLKRIVKQWEELKESNIDPRSLICRKVENGKQTKFWLEAWLCDKPLKDNFPRLFCLETNKNATVDERVGSDGGNWSWRGHIRDGRSMEELENLKKAISSITLSDKKDYWVCKGGPKKKFTVEWMRKQIDHLKFSSGDREG